MGDWVTALAAVGGAAVGGGITIVGQSLDARRRSRSERDSQVASILADVAEGSAAMKVQPNREAIHQLRAALFRLIFVAPAYLRKTAVNWVVELDHFADNEISDTEYRHAAITYEGELLVIGSHITHGGHLPENAP
jgi:hypothetical protein